MESAIVKDEQGNALDEPEADIWIWVVDTLLMDVLDHQISVAGYLHVFLSYLLNMSND